MAAAGLLLLVIALQVARARWEEGVLARAFPDFAAYRSQTSFLMPADPLRFLASFVTVLSRATSFRAHSRVHGRGAGAGGDGVADALSIGQPARRLFGVLCFLFAEASSDQAMGGAAI